MESNDLGPTIKTLKAEVDFLDGELAAAKAEIERLRAALEDVLSYVPHGDLPLNLYDKARAALEGRT